MTSVRPRLAGLVAAALVAAAGLIGLSSGPAAAALCSGGGVNVVVDFQGLGGGVQKGCDRNGAGRAGDKVFPAAGFSLTYAQREPGFVCRVKNAPQSASCVNTSPTNAYWGLYWSNGKNGVWNYSSSGVGGTKVPSGGFLAFSWQNGGPNEKPRASAVNQQSAPATKAPTKKATKPPTKKQTQQSSGASQSTNKAPGQTSPEQPSKTKAAAGASQPKKKAKAAKVKASKKAEAKKAKAKAKAKARKASSSAAAAASADPSDQASPDVNSAEKVNSTFTPEEDQGGLPVWVPIVVIVALAGSAGGAAWWRRRTGAT